MKKICFKNRKFKFWFYHITHGEALIRSVKDKDNEMNIDIYFADIQYIEIPYVLNDLQLAEANKDDAAYLSTKLGKQICIENIRVLISNGKRFYIVSSIMELMENKLEIYEIPLFTFIRGRDEYTI